MIQRVLSVPRCSLLATSKPLLTSSHLLKRLASTHPSATLSSLSPFSARLTFGSHIMSNLPPKPSLDLSLPARPVLSAVSVPKSTSNIAGGSLLSRLSHALPAKPTVAPPPPLSDPYYRPRDGHYDHRYTDSYIARSPSPPPRRYDTYIPRSPPPRSYRDREDSYARPTSRSPSPYRSPRSPRSPRRSYWSSASPVKRAPSPAEELPKTFFTYSHKKQEQRATALEEKARLRKEAAVAYHQEQAAKRAAREEEYRERSQAVKGDYSCVPLGECGCHTYLYSIASSKRLAEETPSGQPSAKLHKSIPTGPSIRSSRRSRRTNRSPI